MITYRPKLGDVVEVDWDDSIEFTGWNAQEEVLDLVQSITCVCRSVGYVFNSDKKYLTLASHMGLENGNITGVMRIPRACVIVIRKLRDGKVKLGKETS